MDKITKMKKLIIAIIGIIVFAIICGSNVKAYEEKYLVFNKSNDFTNRGMFTPYSRENEGRTSWVFCIQHGKAYSAALTLDDYKKWKDISTYGKWCTGQETGKPPTPPEGQEAPWNQTDEITDEKDNKLIPGSFMEYSNPCVISAIEHQDVAYILAESKAYDDGTAYDIWSTSINSGNPLTEDEWKKYTTPLATEAAMYKLFYNSIHSETTDIFQNRITNQTGSVKVMVDQNADTYTVGPFKISYPNGQYKEQNKFSWITGITAITDAGDYPVTVLDEHGNQITGLGQNEDNTLDGKRFYIRFNSTTATKLKVRIDFGYIESCSAEMVSYEGHRVVWAWVSKEIDGVQCNTLGHTHYQHESDGGYPCTHTASYPVKQWVKTTEVEKNGDDTQTTLHVFNASKNYKTASIEISVDGWIDLTMRIEGKVFLDQDSGKVNTGNNKLDAGEGLGGVEVSLYDSDNNLIAIKLTGNDGSYSFDKLNSQKKYYVTFVYNGMLYTNVLLDTSNSSDGSKATEDGQGHTTNRQSFNGIFAEIGSYPSNYETIDWQTGRKINNQVYRQEEISNLFIEVAKAVVDNGGDEKKAYQQIYSKYGSSINSKLQFVIDCRIKAYTVKKYPLIDEFVIDSNPVVIGGKTYYPIYAIGTYDQLHVNLGIKARPTIDLALSKDVLSADVMINGKTETYEYDSRFATSAFTVGIREDDYLNNLRGAYIGGAGFTNANMLGDLNKYDNDTYNLNMRSEEVANGQSGSYSSSNINNAYTLNEPYENLQPKLDGTKNEDRLKIFVTYKLTLKNQSTQAGAITEIVDYYDTNYKFVEAYVGNSKGEKTGNVTPSNTSIYGTSTEYKSNKGTYNTIYLRPANEMRLYRESGVDATEQYIYVKLELVGKDGDVGTLLSDKLINDQTTLKVMNLAEINGYRSDNGLIDIDSNPGNLNISNIDELTHPNIQNYPNIDDMYEDDTSRAPTIIYQVSESRTIEGIVFEDKTGKDDKVYTAEVRQGNGKLDPEEKGINGVIVELIEIKDGQMIVRATTKTNQNGWYGFTGFVPGDYTIRYTYGADNNTALATSSPHQDQYDDKNRALNDKSYNGQDYQSTIYRKDTSKDFNNNYFADTDVALQDLYDTNNNKRNKEEESVDLQTVRYSSEVEGKLRTKLDWYNTTNYWYDNKDEDRLSDARDDEYRVGQVQDYSRKEYGKEITNHKGEVFSAYINPQQSHITEEYSKQLVDELERRTYRYAYTPVIEIEVEFATQTTSGTKGKADYAHKIEGVDFGIVERPKQELVIDQDVASIKVTLANGTVLFDNVTEQGPENLQWINDGDIDKFDDDDKEELINIIMDEELINGAQVEITYDIRVKNNSENNSENNIGLTNAKNILNYISNNVNFDEGNSNNAFWEIVSREEVQTDEKSTYVNNSGVDLTTQSIILKAKAKDDNNNPNPLLKALKPGESTEPVQLTVKKVLSTENSSDDLRYTNLTEIVEIVNEFGRYDNGAIPGNQKTNLNPTEHDTSGASKYTDLDHKPDGEVVVTPPTGSNYNYYMYIIIGIEIAAILLVGVIIIKKLIVKKQ